MLNTDNGNGTLDLKLVEVYQNSSEQNTVYRFKAYIQKNNKEMRVLH
jgi:hypothetical protein